MPELPEVEVVARELDRCLRRQTIARVIVRRPKMVSPAPTVLARQLRGQKINGVRRRAKMIVVELSGGKYLVAHLKMTGQLIYRNALGKFGAMGGHAIPGGSADLPNRYTHIEIHLANGGVLFFNDQRQFGWLKLLSSSELAKLTDRHGLEPLGADFSLAALRSLVARYPKRKLKQFLLDQGLIAGIGNIYADELGWLIGARPSRLMRDLSPATVTKLARAIPAILKRSISHGGTTARDFRHASGKSGNFAKHLKVYGRGGQPCRRCGTVITKTKQQGRGTHYCSKCQI